MRAIRSSVAAAVLFWASVGCGRGSGRDAQLANELVEAIRTRSETRCTAAYVRPGDTTPSGKYTIAMKAGGATPDAAWDAEASAHCRRIFDSAAGLGIDPVTLAVEKIETVKTYEVADDADRRNLETLTAVVRSSAGPLRLTVKNAMLSHRGWVLTGDSEVQLTRR